MGVWGGVGKSPSMELLLRPGKRDTIRFKGDEDTDTDTGADGRGHRGIGVDTNCSREWKGSLALFGAD